jgi:hypothetical protein
LNPHPPASVGGCRLTQAATEKLAVVSIGPGALVLAKPEAPSNTAAPSANSTVPSNVSVTSPAAG